MLGVISVFFVSSQLHQKGGDAKSCGMPSPSHNGKVTILWNNHNQFFQLA